MLSFLVAVEKCRDSHLAVRCLCVSLLEDDVIAENAKVKRLRSHKNSAPDFLEQKKTSFLLFDFHSHRSGVYGLGKSMNVFYDFNF